MKTISLFFALVILTPALTFASVEEATHRKNKLNNVLLQFVARIEGLKQFALYSVISKRCYTYLPLHEAVQCDAAVEKMLPVLNFDLLTRSSGEPFLTNTNNPSSFVFVAFKQNLIKLLAQPRMAVYLNDIQQELSKFLTAEKPMPVNLWKISLKHFKNEEAAAMVIAALFQDTSPVKMHLLYLELARIRGSQHFEDNKELLGRVIDTIHMVLDYSGESFRTLFFPEDVKSKLNGTIYHFYVPMYLSKALRSRGVPVKYASMAPLMLTLSYEFVTTSSDYTYIFRDPPRITDRWKLNDIYAGHNGVSFGMHEMHFLIPFSNMSSAFGRSTRKGVELLLGRW